MWSKHMEDLKEPIYYDIDTQSANFWGNPFRQATEGHLNNI